MNDMAGLLFQKQGVTARFISPSGEATERDIEIRIHPITRRKCRVALSRIAEKEPGTASFPPPPPEALETSACPFCQPQLASQTPKLHPDIHPSGRLTVGDSLLFPNLFPYGAYSAVSLFDNTHFVEIGTASLSSYTHCFMNCAQYLKRVLTCDPEAIYMAIVQNHLPSAGGSLLHPHLQIHADRISSNHHHFLQKTAATHFQETGACLFSDYLRHEKNEGSRYIGTTGDWEWMAAFAPEGFFEIWGILPARTSLKDLNDEDWEALARGVLNTQKFYRSLCRNGYNLGMLFVEDKTPYLELRVVIQVRSNYAPWVRNDFTSYEVMLGDMTTFVAPENTATQARAFWGSVSR